MAKNRKRVNDVGGRRDQFSAMLGQLCDIAAEDAAEQICASRLLKPEEKKEDVMFYLNQCSGRTGTMCGNDKQFKSRVERQQWRQHRTKRARTAQSEAGQLSPEAHAASAAEDFSEDSADGPKIDEEKLIFVRKEERRRGKTAACRWFFPETS